MATRRATPDVVEKVFVHFSELEDPRIARTRRHELMDVLVMSLCGVICGADGWEALAEYAESKQEWFEEVLGLQNGTPSADTFRRVICALDTTAFEACFRSWIRDISQRFEREVVALDGKSLRGAFTSANSTTPLHLVSAWATKQRLVLAQKAAVGGASGEPAAMVAILKMLDLKGAIVTTDANGCTVAVTAAVRAAGGDYVVTLKGNRAPQLAHVQKTFAQATDSAMSKSSTTNSGHGRQEARIVYALPAAGWEWPDWCDVRSFVMVERVRETSEGQSTETHFYISSLKPNAELFADAIRAHWGIENELHWMLDVVFREDDQRIRDQRGAENFAVLNRLALMLLRNEKTRKVGAPTKRKRAGWSNEYLARVLTCGLGQPE